MKNFNDFSTYLSGVMDSDSLRNMALRFLFSEISEDYVLGIEGYRLELPDALILDFSAGLSYSSQAQVDNLWDSGPLALCIRRGLPLEESRQGHRITYIPLLRREVPLGAIVLIGESSNALPKEFSWMIASMSVAGGRILAGENSRRSASGARPNSSPEKLNDRQLAILDMMSRGLTNDQIARHLHVSNSTIRHESMRIFRYLEVPDRASASAKGKELGLIDNSSNADSSSGAPSLFAAN